MAAILNSAILNSTILYSGILHNNNLTHSFSFNLMMGAILNSAILDSAILYMLDSDTAILDSDTLLSSLRFTQKHSHSTLTLTQTNSIWFKLIHFHWTWWWQPSWILQSWIWPSWIQPSNIFLSNSLTFAKIGPHHLHKKTSFIHSGSTWWWQPYWKSQTCHLGFRHLVIFFQIHSKTLSLYSDSDSN